MIIIVIVKQKGDVYVDLHRKKSTDFGQIE